MYADILFVFFFFSWGEERGNSNQTKSCIHFLLIILFSALKIKALQSILVQIKIQSAFALSSPHLVNTAQPNDISR